MVRLGKEWLRLGEEWLGWERNRDLHRNNFVFVKPMIMTRKM
jgi:hypothetical protein